MTPCPACQWPHHATRSTTVVCVKCGGTVEIIGGLPANASQESKQEVQEKRKAKENRLIACLRWLSRPEDRGLGDTVERILAMAGGRKIKQAMASLSLPCKCNDRQSWLNERYPNPKYQGCQHGQAANGAENKS